MLQTLQTHVQAAADQKIKAACEHFDACNGCPLMELPYTVQVKTKEKYLRHFLDKSIDVAESNSNFFYRNKLELAFIKGKLGFRKRTNFQETFSVKSCMLMSEQSNQIVQFLEAELNKQKLDGKISYIVMKEAKRTQETLVTLVSTVADIETEIGEIVKQLKATCQIYNVIWLHNDTLSDVARGKKMKVYGNPFIEEHFMSLRFRIGYENFFQANIQQAEQLFSKVVHQIQPQQTVVDLYCGVGALTLPLARKGLFVYGIELEQASIDRAKENANLNGVGNVEFYAGNVRKVLKELELEADVVCLDPPRAGSEKKVIRRITETGAKKVFYVSCNPTTLKRDLAWFNDNGFVTGNIEGFDFFPNTNHVECLTILNKEVDA
jgi:23S rRNA (uracil1939-C5)-methyltransferase